MREKQRYGVRHYETRNVKNMNSFNAICNDLKRYEMGNWLRGTATRQTYLGKAKKKVKENNAQ